jgi:hypothetical protein
MDPPVIAKTESISESLPEIVSKPVTSTVAHVDEPVSVDESEYLSMELPSSAKTPAGRLLNDSFEPLTPSPRSGLSRQLSKAGDSTGSVPSSPRESNLFRDSSSAAVANALLDSPEPSSNLLTQSATTTATVHPLSTNKVVDDLIDFSVDDDDNDDRNTKKSSSNSNQTKSATSMITMNISKSPEPSHSQFRNTNSNNNNNISSSPDSKPIKTTAVAPPASTPADLMAKYKTKEKTGAGLFKALEKARSKFGGGTEM